MALLALGMVACRSGSPEERLRQQFSAMQAAAEEKRVGDFMEGVSADFAGARGMDRAALHNLLRLRTLGNASIGASTGPLDVQVQGDTATVKFSALLTGGSGRLLPEQMQAYQITSGWRLEDGEWRVYYAQWDPPR
ncbi:nuclear transport factor 2 family protein [Pseudoxanthomonas putridarboris]|uniref:Nuclear transport factor 2 family protein n=1 Tax=Pseudoxanthomonas putridarboris TaxID=752605 RepID=A0ABU9J0W5_9GAMM